MSTPHWTKGLVELKACSEAIRWAKEYESFELAWAECKQGDWMLWIAAHLCERKQVVWAACQCARLGLKYASSSAPLKAIETAEAWTRGEASLYKVRVAYGFASAASAASSASSAAYAAAAYAAAASTTTTTTAASYASYASSYASYATAYAASSSSFGEKDKAAAAAARMDILSACAEIVRREIPAPAWTLGGKKRVDQ